MNRSRCCVPLVWTGHAPPRSTAAGSLTGSKAADAQRAPTSRHSNASPVEYPVVFSPCALANIATRAPGANVSSTLRRFSARIANGVHAAPGPIPPPAP